MSEETGLIPSLHSYPNLSLQLPPDVELLLPRVGHRRVISPRAIQNRLEQALLQRLASLTTPEKRVLLVLPDHTRRSEASHIAIDAVLSLLHQNPTFSLTVLFGLGSHPPMGDRRIAHLLGQDRWHVLQQLAVPILEHTTLQPLPSKPLDVAQPEWMDQGILRLDLPTVVWDSHLLIVAGNTELHPYESRCGSGGLNKMLVIGLGNQSIIHHTHSIKVLTDPAAKDRRKDSRFVQLLDYYAEAITKALMRVHLDQPPLGFSLVCLDPADSAVHGFWLGEEDAERSELTAKLQKERTCCIAKPLDFLMADSEMSKSTDWLAGGRSLHVLCSLDRPNRPILSRSSSIRTAFLLNSCYEVANAEGIGNRGTKIHLDVLAECIQSEITFLLPHSHCTEQLLHRSRTRVLRRWHRYLQLVSIQEELILETTELLQRISRLQHTNHQTIGLFWQQISRRFMRFKDTPGTIGECIRSLIHYCDDGNVLAVQNELSCWRQCLPSYAFAQGGQRALRFLLILQRFERFVLATTNPAVLAYIKVLSPDLRQLKPPTWFERVPIADPFRLDLLGISGVDLRLQTPTQAMQQCLKAHNLLKVPAAPAVCGFVQNPVLVEVA